MCVRILDSGELYYTKSASDDLSVMDYIEDDLASSDAAMQPVEYPDYVWSFEYDTTEAYEAAKAQRDQQMEAYNAYRDKLDRDEMREELKESTISQNRYELYYYNGTEETLVTDSLAYGSLTASAADKAVAVIEVRDEASASKVKISEIEYAYEAESRVTRYLRVTPAPSTTWSRAAPWSPWRPTIPSPSAWTTPVRPSTMWTTCPRRGTPATCTR